MEKGNRPEMIKFKTKPRMPEDESPSESNVMTRLIMPLVSTVKKMTTASLWENPVFELEPTGRPHA